MWRRPSGRVTKEFHFKEKKKISEHVFVFGCSREERKGEKLCVYLENTTVHVFIIQRTSLKRYTQFNVIFANTPFQPSINYR